MHLFMMFTCYLSAALALVSGAFVGLAMLTSPVGSEPSGSSSPKLAKAMDQQPGEQNLLELRPPIQAFRYGPDVIHGRGDTPVNASKQALREARAAAPVKRNQQYQERTIQNPGIAMGFAPSIPQSGH